MSEDTLLHDLKEQLTQANQRIKSLEEFKQQIEEKQAAKEQRKAKAARRLDEARKFAQILMEQLEDGPVILENTPPFVSKELVDVLKNLPVTYTLRSDSKLWVTKR